MATMNTAIEVLVAALIVAGCCWAVCNWCWRVEEHERRDDEEAW